MADEAPKIQIDSDWKAEAQKEKERLSKKEAEATPEAAGERQLPEANFQTLLSTMVTQALFAMGAIPDPQTGQRMAHLDLARHHIDMLTVIEEKTKGNLTEEESDALSTTLYELRNQYVQIAKMAREGALGQPAQSGGAGLSETASGASGGGASGGIVQG